ncbi:helix-turn-helix domain-containing protein [Streptomyces sp. SCSIO 30461]|uniref:helix-turn-helix domain-containing protein n=1 Tax=Streptomyces sp. SCSIO 30461 TaxID=3118085 RepID=UPI0030CDEEC7
MSTVNPDDGSSDSDALAVLELLAREAPSSRFDELLRTARQHPLPQERLRMLERAVRLALDVRATAEQRRRREAGLATLVDTTQELSSCTDDLDGLLHVITSHARRLLNFDMAYVSLRLPGGGSYVHKSDGETTALSVGLELDPGFGLGEYAQSKQAPFWTADYLADGRFPHSPDIDEVVSSEGLHAVLAVPLIHGGAAIGALYGASREIRHFTPDEVSLMRSLAVLSASAIEATRRRARIETGLADVQSENVRLTSALARTDRLTATQKRLMDLVLEGGALHDVTKAAAEALDGTLVLRDAEGRTLAATGELPQPGAASVVRALVDSHAAGAPVRVSGDGGSGAWVTHVTTGVEAPGTLLFRRPVVPAQHRAPDLAPAPRSPQATASAASHPAPAAALDALTEEDKGLLYATAQTLALVLLLGHSAGAAAGPARDECLEELLAGAPESPRRLSERVRRLGIDPGGQHLVLIVRPEGGKQGESAVWASSYAYRHGGLKTVRGDCLVLLIPGTDASAAARAAAGELSPLLGQPVSVGSAGPTSELSAVGKVYQEARRCLDTLVALGRTGGTASPEDLGFLGLLLSDDHDADAFVHNALGAVLDYDSGRSTDLVRTLEAYFTAGGSPTRAAQQLHVHTNTVARRLDRITELLGPHWQEPARALEIQLALRLRRAQDAVYRRPGETRRAQADREA